MARVINNTYRVKCNHCGKTIEFYDDDIYRTITRGLEMGGSGWIDADCEWSYIDCPNCFCCISVDSAIKNIH